MAQIRAGLTRREPSRRVEHPNPVKRQLILPFLFALVLAACGSDDSRGVDVEPDEALLQITSEGGFVPIEFALNNGPRYTVLGDGSVIYQGPQPAIFPGPIYVQPLVAQMSSSQLNALLAIVDRIGLPEIEDEIDDSANQFVADATTEVVAYWDENGEHRFGVYALGLTETSTERNDAFLELIETLDRFTAQADAVPYEPDRVRILAGEGFVDQAVKQVRDWPDAIDPSVFRGVDHRIRLRRLRTVRWSASLATPMAPLSFLHPGNG